MVLKGYLRYRENPVNVIILLSNKLSNTKRRILRHICINIPKINNTQCALFGDDTAIIATSKVTELANKRKQNHLSQYFSNRNKLTRH